MKSKSTILIAGSLLLAFAGMMPSPASAQITPCDSVQEKHIYAVTLGAFIVINGGPTGAGGTQAADLSDPNGPCAGDDGDPETAISGGIFPSGYLNPACVYGGTNSVGEPNSGTTATVAHHSDAAGTAYRAVDTGPFGIIYSAGTDGPLPADPTGALCHGDGVISDGDPYDCGEGELGVYEPTLLGIDTAATLEPTVDIDPLNPDANGNTIPNEPGPVPVGDEVTYSNCDSADGHVAVFIFAGPVVNWCGPNVNYAFLSLPTTGHIEEGGTVTPTTTGCALLAGTAGVIKLVKVGTADPVVVLGGTPGWACGLPIGSTVANTQTANCANVSPTSTCLAVTAAAAGISLSATPSTATVEATSTCGTISATSGVVALTNVGAQVTPGPAQSNTWTCAWDFANWDADDVGGILCTA